MAAAARGIFEKALVQNTFKRVGKQRTYAAVANDRFVKVFEQSPRDGLQNEAKAISVETKVELIKRLLDSGLKQIGASYHLLSSVQA